MTEEKEDRDNVYSFGKYTINFDTKKISYWTGRYAGDDYYDYLKLNNDRQFYEQAISIIREEGRNEIRKGIKELLDVKERF